MSADKSRGFEVEYTTDKADDRSYHEQVAILAYRLWQERGCPDGSPATDWLQAEQEVLRGTDAAEAGFRGRDSG